MIGRANQVELQRAQTPSPLLTNGGTLQAARSNSSVDATVCLPRITTNRHRRLRSLAQQSIHPLLPQPGPQESSPGNKPLDGREQPLMHPMRVETRSSPTREGAPHARLRGVRRWGAFHTLGRAEPSCLCRTGVRIQVRRQPSTLPSSPQDTCVLTYADAPR
jgi:hypothetical protein